MALPQNPEGITNTDRLMLNAVNAQTDNLNKQTKVLHTVSDLLLNQNKEFSKLRKDVQELSRTFIQGNNSNFAEIKKYFEKSKAQNREQPRMYSASQKNKSDEEKGFFKGLVGKLFGPSKYQQKMMDDTSSILNFSQLISSDISFIKKQYDEPAKARERELLSQAIADKINAHAGGDSGGGGGLLAAIGGTLLAGIGIAIKGLADFIMKGFDNIITPGLKILERALLGALSGASSLLSKIIEAIAALAGSIWDWLKSGKLPTTIPPEEPPPKTPGGQANRNQPRLPAPNKIERLLPNANGLFVPESELPQGSNWWDKVKSYGSGIGLGLKRLINPITMGMAATGAAYNYGMPDDIKKDIADFIQEQFPGAPLADWLGPEGGNEYYKIRSLRDTRKTMKEIQQKRIAEENSKSGFPGYDEAGKPIRAFGHGSIADENTLDELTINLKDNVWSVDGALKKLTDSLFEYEQKIEDATVKVLDFVAPKIDQMTEIDFGNGQKLNLAPNLGTSLVEVLKEVAQETKDLVVDATSGLGDITTNIVNNVAPPKQDLIAFPTVMAEEQLKFNSGMAAFRLRLGLK